MMMMTVAQRAEAPAHREITPQQLAEAMNIVRLSIAQEQQREKKSQTTDETKHTGFNQTPRNLIRRQGIFASLNITACHIIEAITDLFYERGKKPIHESYESLGKILNIAKTTLNNYIPKLIEEKFLISVEKRKTSKGKEVLVIIPNTDWFWKDNDAIYGKKKKSESTFFCASESSQSGTNTIPNRDEPKKGVCAQNGKNRRADHPKLLSTIDKSNLNTNRNKEEEGQHLENPKNETSSSCPSLEKNILSFSGSRQNEEQKEETPLQDYPTETITLAKEVAVTLGFSYVDLALLQYVHETKKEYPTFDIIYAAQDESAYRMRKNDVVTFDSFKGCCKNQIKHKRLVPVSAGPVLPPAGSLPVSPAAAPLFPASSPAASSAATENGGGNDYGEIEQLCSNIYEQCQKLSIRRPRLSMEEPGSHPNVPGWYLTCRWTKEDEALIVTSMEEWEALLEERLQQKGDA